MARGTRDDSGNEAPRPRRAHDRDATESELLDAAWELLQRDGVLAGLNLRDVADAAQVNRALIYRYFGSREALLRAALRNRNDISASEFAVGRELPFVERRMHAWRTVGPDHAYARVLALLALADDDEVRTMPFIAATRQSLDADRERGTLPADVDGPVAHAMTVATYLGYAVFRNMFARELGLELDELDAHAEDIFERMVNGIATPRPSSGPPSSA